MAGRAKVRFNGNAARAVLLESKPARGGRGAHARCPDDRGGANEFVAEPHALPVAMRHRLPETNFNAEPSQGVRGVVRELFGKVCEQALPRFDQEDARLPRVDHAEIARERPARELGNGAGELDTRRPAPDDGDRQQPRGLSGIRSHLCAFECQQESPPDRDRVIQRLESWRMLSPFVVPEIAVGRAGCKHEPVVCDGRRSERDDLPRAINGSDFAHQHARIVLAPHQAAHGPGDVGWRKPGTRNLVQERLEKVVILAVNQRDIGVDTAQAVGGGEAAETRANDDDSSFCHVSHWH